MSQTVESDGLPWEATFVENMTRARKALGMSQTALAKKLAAQGLPFHQPTVQRIEAGERPVRLNEAVAIAQALFMDDLHEAITPNTVERATQVLQRAIAQSAEEWSEVMAELQAYSERALAAKDDLTAERSFYVRTMQGLGNEYDANLAGAAEEISVKWWALHRVLQVDADNVRQMAWIFGSMDEAGMDFAGNLTFKKRGMSADEEVEYKRQQLRDAEQTVQRLRNEFLKARFGPELAAAENEVPFELDVDPSTRRGPLRGETDGEH